MGSPPATPMWQSEEYYIPSSNNSTMDVSGALDFLNNDLLNNCFNFSDDHILVEDSFSGIENIIPFNLL